MDEGETALVRQSGEGVMGIWEIDETKPIESQRYHNWEEEYSRFVYCRALEREFDEPLNEDFLEGQDYVRFNAGANKLSADDAELFLTHLLQRSDLSKETRVQLQDDLNAIQSEKSGTAEGENTSTRLEDLVSISDTTGTARTQEQEVIEVSEAFRKRTLSRYNDTCLLTDITGSPFITLAHVLPRADYSELAEDPENVLILNWLHHRAFDADLFTFESDLKLRIHPDFSTTSDFLQRTLADREGEKVELPPYAELNSDYLETRNEGIDWLD